MRNSMIKLGSVVPDLRVADVRFNTKEIIQLAQKNRDCGLLVFPELSLTGYTCQDLFQSDALLDAAERGLSEIAAASSTLPGMTLVVGLPVRFRDRLLNCAAFVSEGRIAALIPKSSIPTYSEFYESRWFQSGRDLKGEVVTLCSQNVMIGTDILVEDKVSGAVIAADICEDVWVPDKPSTHACLAGANIIVNPSASDELLGKEEYRRSILLHQSADLYCGYIYVSSGMGESSQDLVFSGHQMTAECGQMLGESIFPDLGHSLTSILDLDRIRYNRLHQGTFHRDEGLSYRRAEVKVKPLGGAYETDVDALAGLLGKESYRVASNPFVPKDSAEVGRRSRSILRIQASGLATRCRNTGIKTLVIGISGGLDSTLALIVCHEARKIVPDIRIIGYTMPSKGHTSSLTYNNAMDLMRLIGCEIRECPIQEPVMDHLRLIGHGTEYKGDGDTTYENAQARMRTYILMDAANMEGGLVVGTGDLSELALGWCTYNGDHMSMYAVNASVPKTLVRYICQSYAHSCGDEELKRVLISIVETPITPELTPSLDGTISQKTEDKIGKYELNDFFLFYTLRYGYGPEKIAVLASLAYPDLGKERLKEALTAFYRRFFSQQFKRSCLPDGPKVGSVTLSPRGDWRMPSDASSSLWISIVREL